MSKLYNKVNSQRSRVKAAVRKLKKPHDYKTRAAEARGTAAKKTEAATSKVKLHKHTMEARKKLKVDKKAKALKSYRKRNLKRGYPGRRTEGQTYA